VIAFIYADLIIIPIVLAYRKFYGGRAAARIVALMLVAMITAALVVDVVFTAAGLVPTQRPSIDSITSRGIGWNYTTVLNILFLFVAAALVALTLRRGAKDPVCGMTVDRRKTSQHSRFAGTTVYFCSAHCKHRFDGDPERYVAAGQERAVAPAVHAGHHQH
jgi:YHS domain-containing protein